MSTTYIYIYVQYVILSPLPFTTISILPENEAMVRSITSAGTVPTTSITRLVNSS